ncbi:response regulator [Dolichospermum sp. ST_con]|jgi:CheY-like chemotaxis protein|nr:response regulator [Dolichospermum sp. ST_con]MDD1422022.1 response regulator [Dolichospermum sp. ST_sed1]MDD1423911.1 response regulator [Dolichospermum sp. ST_sed9]MDD1430428.1 response regulator [Dolichospermum sp. ST_sed6]MDD1439760.1 response regulator [Dolichospermum sp. ST_sed3]MDD1445646.1 response regulator [Dolichospermum sp. ST_sed8]MDD1453994.1 response regulator [Dolichospermum sp. ST_sed7]MDD1459748.1 response regulator [Dolichospermum sp. ST_sed2]MDD1465069.1 response regu
MYTNSDLQSGITNTIAKKKILVVDDNTDILILLQYCLQDIGGWDVITASSGNEALIKVKAEKPDAIILDGIMPQMNGLMFLKELRSIPEMQSLPVILLTGSTILTEDIPLLDLDVVGTITKPFEPMLITQQIAQFLGWKI